MAIGEKKQNATFGGEQAFRPGAANDGSCPRRNQRQSRQDNASTVSTDYAMHQGPEIHAAEVRLEADMMCTCHKTSWVLKAAGSVSGALPSEGHASLACRKRTILLVGITDICQYPASICHDYFNNIPALYPKGKNTGHAISATGPAILRSKERPGALRLSA